MKHLKLFKENKNYTLDDITSECNQIFGELIDNKCVFIFYEPFYEPILTSELNYKNARKEDFKKNQVRIMFNRGDRCSKEVNSVESYIDDYKIYCDMLEDINVGLKRFKDIFNSIIESEKFIHNDIQSYVIININLE